MNPHVFNGRVPIEIQSNETRIFCFAARCSYLPTQLLPRLAAALPGINTKEALLSHNSHPILKSHYPVGVLYDLLIRDDPIACLQPWKLELRVGEDMDMFITDLKSYFYSQVKEVWEYHVFILDQADFLRNGSVKRSMDLSKKDQEDLWKCIETLDAELYKSSSLKLLDLEREPIKELKSLPYRIYYDARVYQEPLPPGDARTLGELIHGHGIKEFGSVWIHGISPPLDSLLVDLYSQLVYPDGFLHIVVSMKKDPNK